MAAAKGGAPPVGGTNSSGARHAYLVARLRSRQITMEEATELFGIMDVTIRSISAAVAAPPPPPRTAPPARRTEAAPAAPSLFTGDDLLPFGILLVGAATGISAAVRERSRNGPKKPSAPASR